MSEGPNGLERLEELGDLIAAQQAQVNAERALFHTFMSYAPLLAWIKDENLRFVFVNARLLESFHLSEEACLGRSDRELFGAAVADEVGPNDREVLATGRTLYIIETVPAPDGRTTDWQVWKFPLVGADGQVYVGGMAVPAVIGGQA